ncbi:MAG: hypothetical protein K8R36_15275, partial [Planctomycetales bacterium]|nr:hypothetical protein [Planctomycetales bacterium]
MPILFAGTSLMPLRIKCPSGHSLIVSESRAGQTFRCPKCQAEVRVPAKEVPAPPAENPVPVKPPLASETKRPPVPLAKETLQAPKTATLSVPAPPAPPKPPVPPPLPGVIAEEVAVSEPPPVAPPVQEPEPAAPPVIIVSPPVAKSSALAQSMLVAKSISDGVEAPLAPSPLPLPFLPLESRIMPTSPEPPPAAIPPSPAASLPPQKSIAPHPPTSPAAELLPP